jgi:hypothetical protein
MLAECAFSLLPGMALAPNRRKMTPKVEIASSRPTHGCCYTTPARPCFGFISRTRKGAPCPALEIARERRAGAFKKQIRHRFIASRRSLEHYAENGQVFYGSPTAKGLSDADDDSRQALLDNVEGQIRL